MKALTICQPYAELVARCDVRETWPDHLRKPMENRTWCTSYRGPLLIHAGKSRAWLGEDDEDAALYSVNVATVAFGAIVAQAELYDCLAVEKLPADLAASEHANGPFCLLVRNVRRLPEPIPYRGAQGLFDVPDSVLAGGAAECAAMTYAGFLAGRPPFAPLALAASAFASERAFPPLRPRATAAGFLRGIAFRARVFRDVFRGQFRDALHRQGGDLRRQALEGGEIAGFEGGIPAGHQVAACGVHTGIIPNRLGSCQGPETLRKPLAIDLFCGLGGWTEGLIAEGYRVVGFDTERHVYGDERYPAQLVLQDVLTIHGAQFKDAALIVASPPCQAYSYRAMPWKRAKALPPPSNELFDACFRIQQEAMEAAGHFIPLVVENVRGAQPYVGRSKYHFGSFHLWGDVPALMPMARGRKNTGGSWFNVAHNTKSGHGQNPDGRKHGGDCFSDPTWPGKQGGVKHRRISKGWRDKHYDQTEKMQIAGDGVKQAGIAGVRNNGKGDRWFQDGAATHGSKSPARKRASAMIAKIPLVLSRHIAAAWYPREAMERIS